MDPGYYRFFRSITPSGFLKWIDRYNYESQELQDLIQTAPAPIQVQTLDCTVAQTISLPMLYPGRAFVIYFYDSTTTTKTIKPNGFVKVRINDDRAENEFPAKHNRGYRGDYYRLFLTWPAQANTKADLVMHMFDDDPWEMDSINSSSATGTVTSVSVVSANGLAGTVANATTTPAITLSTTVTGVLKGNGTAVSAATAGTDYSAGTSALATGIVKSTTATGALTIAVAGDFPTLNQNTTGTAAGLSSTLVVGSGGTGTGTAFTQGSVVFAGAAGVYSQDNTKFFWDDTNFRLGIGVAAPTVSLDVANSALSTARFIGSGVNGGSLILENNAGGFSTHNQILLKGQGGSSLWILQSDSQSTNANDLDIYDALNSASRIRIKATTGETGIGETSPASPLSVKGGISAGTYSATAAPANGMIISGSVGIGTNNPAVQFHTTGTVRLANFSTGLAHFDGSGNVSSSLVVNADITNSTIDLTAKVTGALPIANGGTASTTASGARTALGLAIGTDVQAFDAQLSSVIRQNSRSANYTTVLTDGGYQIFHPASDNNARTFTIDSNANVAYPIGTAITFINEINTVTIAITSDTLHYSPANTTGSRTLAAGGIATAVKTGTTSWWISGSGLT